MTSGQIQEKINDLRLDAYRDETGQIWADMAALEDQRMLVEAAEIAQAAKFEGYVTDGSTEHGMAIYSNVAI